LKTLRNLFAVLIVTLYLTGGCSGPGSGGEKASNSKAGQTVTVQADQAGTPPQLVISGDTIKISGSKSGEVTFPAKQGGYLINYRYKGDGLKLEAESPLGKMNLVPGSQLPGADGWTAFTDLTSFFNSGDQSYQVTATEPYEIEFVKLPLSRAADPLPKTYSGKGMTVIGPFSLKAGSVSFKVTCPDLKMAGFIAELYDDNGKSKGMIAMGTGPSVDETKKLEVPSSGAYLTKVTANSQAEWTIEVTQ